LRNICRQSLRFPPPSHNFCTPYHDPNSDSGPSSKRKIPTLISFSIIHERLRTFWVQTSSPPLSIARFRPSPNNMTTYQFLPLDHHLPPSEKPTPGSFKLFPQLPLELRRKIWLHAVPRPRIFKLLERNEDDEEVGWTCMTEEERQTPGILFACWESRAETRKFFQLCFEKAAASPPTMRSAVYVNFAIDAFILIPRKHCTTSTVNRNPGFESFNFSSDFISRIQHYQISVKGDKGSGFPWQTHSFLVKAMLTKDGLKDITFRLLQSSKKFAAYPSLIPIDIRDCRMLFAEPFSDLWLLVLIKRKIKVYCSPVIWLDEPESSPSRFFSWATVVKSIVWLSKSGWILGQCAIWIIVGCLFGIGLGLITCFGART